MTRKMTTTTNAAEPAADMGPSATRPALPPSRGVRASAASVLGADQKVKAGPASKRDQLIRMLSAKNGADVATISIRLGWLPHTARAALSGLRKAGYPVATEKRPDGQPTRYRIAAQIGAASPDGATPLATGLRAPESRADPTSLATNPVPSDRSAVEGGGAADTARGDA